MYSVSLAKIVSEFNLQVLTPNIDLGAVSITHKEVNRPALQLAGFFDYFETNRIQLIGKVEHTFLSKMDPALREDILEKILQLRIPCFVLCRELEPFPEMLMFANKNSIPLLQTIDDTSDFMGELIRFLKVELAPRITMHGVFVDVFGEGVLILGESGVGKSEMALELIKRGHRLIADDAVDIRKVSNVTLYGTCPELIRHFLELRGIGIIDVREMFGVGSIKETQTIDLIIKLEDWDDSKQYDRLGVNEEYMEILGNNIVCHSIPIRPGRNLAVIGEAAAINHRQKKMGYNTAKVFDARVLDAISRKQSKE